MLCQPVLDFTVAWDRLTNTRSLVLVPIVATSVTEEDAAALFDLSYGICSLHAI